MEEKKKTQKKQIVKETRDISVTLGTGGTGGITPRIFLPYSWLKHMGVETDDRRMEITYSPRTKKITIRKKSSEVSKEEVGK